MAQREHYFFVCNNVRPEGNPRPSCGRSGAAEIQAALKALINEAGLGKTVARVCTSSCLDMCDDGPVVLVEPEHVVHTQVKAAQVGALLQGFQKSSPAGSHDEVLAAQTPKDR